MRVAIAVHGRFHAFDAARELAARGVGVWLATTYPAMVARRMLPASIALHTIPHLEVARRVAARMSFLPPIDVWLASRFSSSVARELPASADIFVGWSGASSSRDRPWKTRREPLRGRSGALSVDASPAQQWQRHTGSVCGACWTAQRHILSTAVIPATRTRVPASSCRSC